MIRSVPMIPPRRKTEDQTDLIRKRLWVDTWLVLANHDSAGTARAKDWANKAVAGFDKKFPKDGGPVS